LGKRETVQGRVLYTIVRNSEIGTVPKEKCGDKGFGPLTTGDTIEAGKTE